MKRHSNVLIATIIVSLLSLTVFTVVAPGSASALTAKECTNRYNGKILSQNKYNAYLKTNCAQSKGGKCTATSATTQGVVDRTIKCGNAQQGGDNADDKSKGDALTDPALDAECDKDGCQLIKKYVNPLIVTLTALVGLAVVIGIIVGALQVMTSAGDPQQAAKGKDHIRNAIVAIVAYMFLYAGLQFILPGGFL